MAAVGLGRGLGLGRSANATAKGAAGQPLPLDRRRRPAGRRRPARLNRAMCLAAEHRPVLLAEAAAALVADPDGAFVDATFGRGGHARALLARLSGDSCLLALDRDAEAVAAAAALAAGDRRVTVCHGAFGDLTMHLAACGFGPLSGALFDVGLSSAQLADAERGFSFASDGPLDMRFDQRQEMTAAAWLNAASERDLATALRRNGEVREARRVARHICRVRPLTTTAALAAAVARALPGAAEADCARVFQAVRIQVNDELGQLRSGLESAFAALAVGGRLAAITFHSLEHRLVRELFRTWVAGPPRPPRLPAPHAPELARYVAPIGRGRRPSAGEAAANPRARSALLQVVQKTAEQAQP